MHGGTMLTDAIRQWRTPDAPNAGGPRNRQTSIGHGHQVTIAEQAEHWRTPTLPNGGRTTRAEGSALHLDTQAGHWPTPGTTDGEQAVAHKGGNPTLNGRAMLWPTPAAEPYGSSQNGINGKGGANERPSANTPSLDRLSRSFLPLLQTLTDGEPFSPSDPTSHPLWETPRVAVNTKSAKAMRPHAEGGHSSPPGLAQQAAGSASLKGKPKLNPQFVEWLMGWPIGWTASALAATEWSAWQQRMRSALYALVRSGGCE